MQTRYGSQIFTHPATFNDATSYCFRSEDGSEELQINTESLISPVATIDELLVKRRRKLENSPLGIYIEEQLETHLLATSARVLVFATTDGGTCFRTWWAFALPDPQTCIQAVYRARLDVSGAGPTFSRVVADMTRLVPNFAVPGWIWRSTGDIYVHLPERLRPPSTYIFLSPDETMRVEIDFASEDFSIAEIVARDALHAEHISDKHTSKISIGTIEGHQYSYVASKERDDGTIAADQILRAHVRVARNPAVTLYGRAPQRAAEVLLAALTQVIRSLREVR